MRNLKFPLIFAGFGFALSLIFGFFSRSHFGIILLRALIFAVIFFAIGFAIKIIYGKFLEGESSDFDSEQLGSSDQPSASSESFAKGQHVDFVVRDEELDSETSDNHYVVGQNHQMLSESDIHSVTQTAGAGASSVQKTDSSGELADSKAQNTAVTSVAGVASNSGAGSSGTASTASGFVPLGKENFQKVSGTEAVQSANVQAADTNESASGSGELDVLPDMSDLQLDNSSESSGEDAETDESDFGGSSVSYKNKNSSDTEVKDASLMAKAISSLLSAESE